MGEESSSVRSRFPRGEGITQVNSLSCPILWRRENDSEVIWGTHRPEALAHQKKLTSQDQSMPSSCGHTLSLHLNLFQVLSLSSSRIGLKIKHKALLKVKEQCEEMGKPRARNNRAQPPYQTRVYYLSLLKKFSYIFRSCFRSPPLNLMFFLSLFQNKQRQKHKKPPQKHKNQNKRRPVRQKCQTKQN